jgi:hypothetical protein
MIKLLKELFTPVKLLKATYKDEILSLWYSDRTKEHYKGDCTVWHEYPMMKRCSTSQEYYLHNIWEYIETHGNPYPRAHKEITK